MSQHDKTKLDADAEGQRWLRECNRETLVVYAVMIGLMAVGIALALLLPRIINL